MNNLTRAINKTGLGRSLPCVEGLIMLEEYRRAVDAPRKADAVGYPDTESDFPARERRWVAEVLDLQSSWSFIERLYALPF